MTRIGRQRAQVTILCVAAALVSCRAASIASLTLRDSEGTGPRVLCVVAHPDDEISFAGTLFKTSTFLDGTCDVVAITNGEGGFKYSTLGEFVYGLELTDEHTGRLNLPKIRRDELAAGCDLLGVRRIYFLNQTDHRYTQDPLEVLAEDARIWDLEFVERSLARILDRNDYDFVFVLAPTAETHGHHKAATILALRAVAGLPLERRPAVLCGTTATGADDSRRIEELEGFPITRIRASSGFVFDRRQRFGYRDRLDYRIVVNWAIAEHKSQGTMQLLMNRGDREEYSVFEVGAIDATEHAQALFDALSRPQFEPLEYLESAGTNTGSTR